MQYADEFPRFRGWSRRDDPDTPWERYHESRGKLGRAYTQLVLRPPDGRRIGESFFAPVKAGRNLGDWRVLAGLVCVVGDIELVPEYWGKRLGIQAIGEVVRFAFAQTGYHNFVAPPIEKNPAAIRGYEKAGFPRITGTSLWSGHMLMTLARERQ